MSAWERIAAACAAVGTTPIELTGSVFGLLCVLLYARQNPWSWPTGLVQVLLYIWIFHGAKLYADMGLQVVYVGLTLWGWRQWLRGGAGGGALAVARVSRRQALALAAIAATAFPLMGAALDRWTDSDVPWWDSAPTVLSLVAQWMIGRKLLENWWVWIAADCIYIPLFASKGLWFTAGLYGVFLVLCILGLRAWTRSLRQPATAVLAA